MISSTNEIYWGAGLIEGEGYFSLNGPSRRTPMVGLGMTDRDTVEKFQKLFASTNTIYVWPGAERKKPFYSVKVVGKNAVGLMFMFFNLLGHRRQERIKEILSVWRSPRRIRKDCVH